jgi:creatinine amidohydrolase/Fe(II)-dependent formamide hydrolase-like protein
MGDPTLASAAKGEQIFNAATKAITSFVEELFALKKGVLVSKRD